jgi:ribosomal protein L17
VDDAVALVENEVRELVRRRSIDPMADPPVVRRLIDEVVADYLERSAGGLLPSLADPPRAARDVYDAVAGLGRLQRYLDDPMVEEIWINEPSKVFIARRGISELTTTVLHAHEVRDLVERMLKSSGRRIDLSTPFVDAMLADGSRLHVVIPDVRTSLVREHPQIRGQSQLARRPRTPRHSHRSCSTIPRGRGRERAERAGRRRNSGGENNVAELPGGSHSRA